MSLKRNDSRVLQGYQEYINGANDDDLVEMELTAAEILFVKKFHEKAISGALLITIVRSYPPKSKARELSRELFSVFKHPEKNSEKTHSEEKNHKKSPKPSKSRIEKAADDREISFITTFGLEEYLQRGSGI